MMSVPPNSNSNGNGRRSSGNNNQACKIRVTIFGAKSLVKKDFFRLPDPYAKISVDGTNQTFSTEPCKATLHPTWNQYFDLYLTRTDSITISIWNHKKLHKEQHSGFLGCVHIVGKAVQRLRDAGPQLISLCKASPNDQDVVRGQIAVSLMSRDAHAAGGSDRLPPTAVVDRMGNVSCFAAIEPSPLPSTSLLPNLSATSQSQQQQQPPRESHSQGQQPPPPIDTVNTSPQSQQQRSSSGTPQQSNSVSSGQHGNSGNSSNNGRRKVKKNTQQSLVNACVGLPEGYETRITEQGQVYFYHVSSGTSSWYHPGVPKELAPGHNFGALPPGWEQRSTPSGKPYFVDHNSRTTHFTDPRLIRGLSVHSGVLSTIPRGGIGSPPNLSSSSSSSSTPQTPSGQTSRHSQNNNSTSNNNHSNSNGHHQSSSASPTGPAAPVSSSRSSRSNRRESQPLSSRDPNTASSSSSSHQSNNSGGVSSPNSDACPPPVPRNRERERVPIAVSSGNTDGVEMLPKYKRDLNAKIKALRMELQLLQPRNGHCRIEVTRKEIFEQSYRQVLKLRVKDLRKRLMVKFKGEEGLDYGGIAREWLHLLSHEMLNPSYGLFQYSHENQCCVQINPDSGVNPDHLSYFQFVGRVLGLAVFHGHHIDGSFTLPFYKMLLNKSITLSDIQAVDPELHQSLTWMLHNDITGVIESNFCVERDSYGVIQSKELKPGGRDIAVTEKNKEEYVRLFVNYRFMRGIEQQFLALQKGFYEVVPANLLKMFDEKELELIIGGIGKIDIEDWKVNTKLKACGPMDRIPVWFWEIVESYDEEMRARLLQFVTGSSRVPIQGFKNLQGSTGAGTPRLFTIHLVEAPTTNLPKSHTCFNRIDIPNYESKEKFYEKLTKAVEETCGFSVE
ncbi:unnamed protein product [Orchesella dallaii]|uniref:E3 ubiquitin-protein ligase n=1 Tax=Orchesella dallaii TaxID=48710 RepID=A0ABP1QGR0_9HEXA